jgi:acyl-CoA thioesterase
MTPLGNLIDSIAEDGAGRWSVNASEDWRQGRTLYGGVSAGLCFAACEKLVPDLPPLRSAQIAFIGPSGGEATLVPTVLRRGKSIILMAVLFVKSQCTSFPDHFALSWKRYLVLISKVICALSAAIA